MGVGVVARARWQVFVAAAMLVAACGGAVDEGGAGDDAAASNDSPDGTPKAGFYSLKITSNADTCTPSRVSGDRGTVLVATNKEGANIPLLFSDGPPALQDVAWTGTHVTLAGCPQSQFELSVVRKSTESLAVDVTEHWLVSGCASPSPSLPLPKADCSATRRYEFSLVKACPATLNGTTCT
jgi:hypothetical protein